MKRYTISVQYKQNSFPRLLKTVNIPGLTLEQVRKFRQTFVNLPLEILDMRIEVKTHEEVVMNVKQ